MLSLGTRIVSKEIRNALGPETTLLWLGFSELGTPAMQDSLGMFSMYLLQSNVWIPCCDTSKHVSVGSIHCIHQGVEVLFMQKNNTKLIRLN